MIVPQNIFGLCVLRHSAAGGVKGVFMSDLQFCRASFRKSEALAIIPKMLFCRPSLNLVKSKVKLRF
jgi:hypothetical protein